MGGMEQYEQEHDMILPGFRFHPTDEELVGFYLRRKVSGRPIGLDIIKQIDIYKYDPWDLAKATVGAEKEWYFFCHRARKYRNSVRPNRVTGNGFWKATGIDKQVLSRDGCVGLKKSLVYYRGSAGKGVKTHWMMHEFRLPPADTAVTYDCAEVWTICRIFKRNVSSTSRKSAPQQQQQHAIAAAAADDANKDRQLLINFDGRATTSCTGRGDDVVDEEIIANMRKQMAAEATNQSSQKWQVPSLQSPSGSFSCSYTSAATDDIVDNVNWDDLGGLMDIIFEPPPSDEHFNFFQAFEAP